MKITRVAQLLAMLVLPLTLLATAAAPTAAVAQPSSATYYAQAAGGSASAVHAMRGVQIPVTKIGPIVDSPDPVQSYGSLREGAITVVATGPGAACRIIVDGQVAASDQGGSRATCIARLG